MKTSTVRRGKALKKASRVPAPCGHLLLGYYPSPYELPLHVHPAPVVVEPGPPVAQEPIQREVVYPTGKYVLHGDWITSPWQWVWIPATSTSHRSWWNAATAAA